MQIKLLTLPPLNMTKACQKFSFIKCVFYTTETLLSEIYIELEHSLHYYSYFATLISPLRMDSHRRGSVSIFHLNFNHPEIANKMFKFSTKLGSAMKVYRYFCDFSGYFSTKISQPTTLHFMQQWCRIHYQ